MCRQEHYHCNPATALAHLHGTHFSFYVFHQISFGGVNVVLIDFFYGCWVFVDVIGVISFLYFVTLKSYFPERNA